MRKWNVREAAGLSAAAALLWTGTRVGAAVDPNVPAFTVPDFYGSANTTYQEWAGFSAPASLSAPTSATNSAGSATWTDRTAATDGAFLTGTAPSHVYSFAGVVNPEIVVPVPADQSGGAFTVVLQAEVLGNTLSTSSFSLLSAGGSTITPTSVVETDLGASGSGFGGGTFGYTVTWTGVSIGGSSFTLDYAASDTSSSQVAARVDTIAAVPEPATASVIASAGIGLLGRRRRRPA